VINVRTTANNKSPSCFQTCVKFLRGSFHLEHGGISRVNNSRLVRRKKSLLPLESKQNREQHTRNGGTNKKQRRKATLMLFYEHTYCRPVYI
jgi:hypothetical protein